MRTGTTYPDSSIIFERTMCVENNKSFIFESVSQTIRTNSRSCFFHPAVSSCTLNQFGLCSLPPWVLLVNNSTSVSHLNRNCSIQHSWVIRSRFLPDAHCGNVTLTFFCHLVLIYCINGQVTSCLVLLILCKLVGAELKPLTMFVIVREKLIRPVFFILRSYLDSNFTRAAADYSARPRPLC